MPSPWPGHPFVGGYVDRVLDGGTCTLTATKGGVTVTGSGPATPDATTTSCGTVGIPRAQLSTGTWTATLTYSTGTASVSAAPVQVEVAQ